MNSFGMQCMRGGHGREDAEQKIGFENVSDVESLHKYYTSE